MPADADASGAYAGAAATHCWGNRAVPKRAAVGTNRACEERGGADKASCGNEPRVMRQLRARSGNAGCPCRKEEMGLTGTITLHGVRVARRP